MVTHDQEEALSIADRIFVMNEGKIMQSGTPKDIYINPTNPFVANFIGMTNFLDGEVASDKSICIGGKIIKVATKGLLKGDLIRVAARPEAIEISPKKTKDTFEGKIRDLEFLGSFVRLHIETPLITNNHLLADKHIVDGSNLVFALNSKVNFTFSKELLNIYKNEG